MRLLPILCALVLVCAMADGKPFFDAIYEALNGGRRNSWGWAARPRPQPVARPHERQGKSYGELCRVHNPNSHLGQGPVICPFNWGSERVFHAVERLLRRRNIMRMGWPACIYKTYSNTHSTFCMSILKKPLFKFKSFCHDSLFLSNFWFYFVSFRCNDNSAGVIT